MNQPVAQSRCDLSDDYRLYLYGEDGRLIAPAMVIAAHSDEAAIAEAYKRVGSNIGAELWYRDHIVKEFSPRH